MRGPIDYIIVGFEGNKFDGSILREIGNAIDKGIVGLVALMMIKKDADGAVTLIDVGEAGDEEVMTFFQKYSADSSSIDDDDMREVADLVENNTAVGLLALEHIWAIPLRDAIVNANGVLVAEGRIHPEAAAELESKK